jgi:soluble lytic murein transglycosylase-like protein
MEFAIKMMRISFILLIVLTFGTITSADMLVLNTGKKLRIQSYRVEGSNMEVMINDRSEMVIPLDWVREIRDEPDPPPAPKVVATPQGMTPSHKGILKSAYADHVRSVSEKYQVDWRLVTAVMKVESNFNPRALSRKGAQGLMQLMPDTAKMYRVKKPYDPQQNIEAGVKHLKKLITRYDNRLELALAAYNAGEKAVDRFNGIPPFTETQQYVQKVLNYYRARL